MLICGNEEAGFKIFPFAFSRGTHDRRTPLIGSAKIVPTEALATVVDTAFQIHRQVAQG